MSKIDDGNDPVVAELKQIASAVSKRDAFRAAAREITEHIQGATAHSLCRDLKEIQIPYFIFFKKAVAEPTRQTAIAAAQEAVNRIVKSTSDGVLKDPTMIAEYGLVDFERDPVYAPDTAATLLENMTDEFAGAIARTGMMTYLNEALNEMIESVIHEDEEDMPISYDGLSAHEERALYHAFIYAARQAMQECNHAAEESDAQIFERLALLKIAAP